MSLRVIALLLSLSVTPLCSALEGRAVVAAVAPPYDEDLRRFGLDGVVRIEAAVGTGGAVMDAAIVDSFVPKDLARFEETLLECARRWRFESSAGRSTETIRFEFELVRESTAGATGTLFERPSTMKVRAPWPSDFRMEFIDPILDPATPTSTPARRDWQLFELPQRRGTAFASRISS